MLPVIFSVGSFQFQTIWLFVTASVLLFCYLVFLQSEDQLLPTTKVFDLLGICAIVAIIIGKIFGLVINFAQIGFGNFLFILEISEVNIWGAILGGLGGLFYFSKKFKLAKIQILDIASLAAVPAAVILYLGKLVVVEVTAMTIFAVIWFLIATFVFAKASAKIQFPSFYLLLALAFVAFSQLIFAIFKPQPPQAEIFNITISALVLTIAIVLFYKRSGRNFVKDMKIIGIRTLEKIKRKLLKEQKTIEGELATLKKDDPLLAERREVSRETGDDAYEFEGHERITVVRNELKKGLSQIKRALAAIGLGKYGKCEKCGKEIGPRRLKVLPEATLCFDCERELEKKTP